MAGCSVVLISIILFIIAVVIVIGVLAVILALAALFFFSGIVLRKKGKKIGYLFLALGVIFIVFLGYVAFSIFAPEKVNIETPTDVVSILDSNIDKLEKYIIEGDVDSLDDLLFEYPELLYYIDKDDDCVLTKALEIGDLETVECMIEHGIRFDDEIINENDDKNYISIYFYNKRDNYTYGDEDTASTEVLEMTKLMIENGASVNFHNNKYEKNALYSALPWICYDEKISEGDIILVNMLIASGISFSHKNSLNYELSLMEEFDRLTYRYDVRQDENYNELRSILSPY